MKCESCKNYSNCMNFFCNDDTNWESYEPLDQILPWQIERINVPFTVIVTE